MQDAAHGRRLTVRVCGADPLEHPVERVGVSEDMVRRLPVGVLVGGAETRHPERRRVGERSAKVGRSGAGTDRRLERLDNFGRIIAEELFGERRLATPARAAAGTNNFGSRPAASPQSAMRSTGCRQAVCSSAPRDATIWPTTVGSTAAACSQPIRSRHSNALLMKSSECPLSANARSVSAASRASASTAGERPAAIAVSRVRSAASRWRTCVQRRNQRLSAAGSGRLASGTRSRRGAAPSQSSATRRAPLNRAR